MTGSRNGIISLWKHKKVEKSKKIFAEWTFVLAKNGRIFAASKDKDVVELTMKLNIVKKFKGRNTQPVTIDANENYLVVGYKPRMEEDLAPCWPPYNASAYVGHVDLHTLNHHESKNVHCEIMVSDII